MKESIEDIRNMWFAVSCDNMAITAILSCLDYICNELSRNGAHTWDLDLEARRQHAFVPDLETGRHTFC